MGEQTELSLAGGQKDADGIIRSSRSRLLQFIRRRVGDEAEAEDIVQEVFYQFAASYAVTEPIEQLMAWLYRVARNKIIDLYRRRRSSRALPTSSGEDLPSSPEEVLDDPMQSPDVLFARSTVWTELADALDELPEEQREVFVLHELEGRSFKEIAAITGEPVSTLLSRKRYAVLHLRDRLQELYDEFEIP
jgi:RNA polymerase sigma factor (sigma-70 family)